MPGFFILCAVSIAWPIGIGKLRRPSRQGSRRAATIATRNGNKSNAVRADRSTHAPPASGSPRLRRFQRKPKAVAAELVGVECGHPHRCPKGPFSARVAIAQARFCARNCVSFRACQGPDRTSRRRTSESGDFHDPAPVDCPDICLRY